MELAKQPQSISKLVNDGYCFFQPLFPKLIPIVLLSWVATIVMWLAGGFLAVAASSVSGFLGATVTFLLIIGVILMSSFFYAAQVARSFGVIAGSEDWIASTWQVAKNKYLGTAGVMILITLIYMCLMGLVFLINTALQSALVAVISFIVLGFASVYLTMRISMSLPTLVIDDNRPIQAISQSFALTKSSFGRIFAVFFLVVAIPSIGFTALNFLLQSALGDGTASGIIGLIITIIQTLIIPVLMFSALIVLFNDLRLRTGGGAENVPEETAS